jgi:hypothetical protein
VVDTADPQEARPFAGRTRYEADGRSVVVLRMARNPRRRKLDPAEI